MSTDTDPDNHTDLFLFTIKPHPFFDPRYNVYNSGLMDGIIIQTATGNDYVANSGEIYSSSNIISTFYEGAFQSLSCQVSLGKGNDTYDGAYGDVANVSYYTGYHHAGVIDGGAGDDILTAGKSATLLLGGDGDDTLFGGSVRTFLDGGAGQNKLIGGDGIDNFIFTLYSMSGSTPNNTIENFDYVKDSVTLDFTAFKGLAYDSHNMLTDESFTIGHAATSENKAQIVLDPDSMILYYHPAGAPTDNKFLAAFAQFVGNPDLVNHITAGNFYNHIFTELFS